MSKAKPRTRSSTASGTAAGGTRERAAAPSRAPDAELPAGASVPLRRWDALLVCALALAVRLPNLNWGLPDVEEEALPMKKAFEMWGWDTGKVNFNPQTAGWPSLSFYLQLLLQKVYYAFGRLTGTFHDRLDFYIQYLIDPTRLAVISRLVSVLATTVTVWVGTRLASRLAGRGPGIMVGLLLALSPMLVEHSQQVTPDILLVMFSALAVDRLVTLYERGRLRDYVVSAAWIALGAACKYTPVLLLPVLYLAHLMRLRREGKPLALAGLNDRRLGGAALVAVLVFCGTSPYLFTDLAVLKRDFGYQAFHMKQGHFGQETQSGSGHWYYLSHILPHALGLPGLILGTAGLAWTAARLRGRWTVVMLSALVFYAVLGALATRFDRYMLPVLVPLSMGVAGVWVMLRPRLARERPAVRQAAAAGLCVLALAPAAWATIEYQRVQSAPSTQWMCKQYVTQDLPRDRNFFTAELYTIQLPSTEVQDQIKASIVFQQMTPEQRHRLLDMRTYEYTFLPMYSTRWQLSAFYYDLRHFEVYDYILTSGGVRNRYEANPNRFPQQVQFYKDLDHYAVLEKEFAPHGRNRGPEIRVYRLTDEGRQRLIADRGPLTKGWYAPYVDRLHAPHFTAFLQSVGEHCYLRERYDLADLFYTALLETSQGPERPQWQFHAAYSKMQSHELDGAAQLFEEYLRDFPQDASGMANLGLIYARQGKLDSCRALWRQVAAQDPGSKLAAWAQQQLALLDAPGGATAPGAAAPPPAKN